MMKILAYYTKTLNTEIIRLINNKVKDYSEDFIKFGSY